MELPGVMYVSVGFGFAVAVGVALAVFLLVLVLLSALVERLIGLPYAFDLLGLRCDMPSSGGSVGQFQLCHIQAGS